MMMTKTKGSAEKTIRDIRRVTRRWYSADYTINRYHNVYGPGMGDKHMVPDFLERMKQGNYSLYVYKDSRSFMYIADPVRATLLLAECASAADEIVDVGSEREVETYNIGKTTLQIANIDAEIELHDSPQGSIDGRAPD